MLGIYSEGKVKPVFPVKMKFDHISGEGGNTLCKPDQRVKIPGRGAGDIFTDASQHGAGNATDTAIHNPGIILPM
jgi:hypothetical protein